MHSDDHESPEYESDTLELTIFGEGITSIDDLQQYSTKQYKIINLHSNKLQNLNNLYLYFPRLVDVNLSSNQINTCDLPELAYLPYLERLDLSSNNIESISDIPFLPNLKHLVIAFNRISFIDELNNNCPSLLTLDIRGNLLSSRDSVKGLIDCIHLTSLTITSSHGNMISQDTSFLSSLFDEIPSLLSIDGHDINHWRKLEDRIMTLQTSELLSLTTPPPPPPPPSATTQASEPLHDTYTDHHPPSPQHIHERSLSQPRAPSSSSGSSGNSKPINRSDLSTPKLDHMLMKYKNKHQRLSVDSTSTATAHTTLNDKENYSILNTYVTKPSHTTYLTSTVPLERLVEQQSSLLKEKIDSFIRKQEKMGHNSDHTDYKPPLISPSSKHPYSSTTAATQYTYTSIPAVAHNYNSSSTRETGVEHATDLINTPIPTTTAADVSSEAVTVPPTTEPEPPLHALDIVATTAVPPSIDAAPTAAIDGPSITDTHVSSRSAAAIAGSSSSVKDTLTLSRIFAHWKRLAHPSDTEEHIHDLYTLLKKHKHQYCTSQVKHDQTLTHLRNQYEKLVNTETLQKSTIKHQKSTHEKEINRYKQLIIDNEFSYNNTITTLNNTHDTHIQQLTQTYTQQLTALQQESDSTTHILETQWKQRCDALEQNLLIERQNNETITHTNNTLTSNIQSIQNEYNLLLTKYNDITIKLKYNQSIIDEKDKLYDEKSQNYDLKIESLLTENQELFEINTEIKAKLEGKCFELHTITLQYNDIHDKYTHILTQEQEYRCNMREMSQLIRYQKKEIALLTKQIELYNTHIQHPVTSTITHVSSAGDSKMEAETHVHRKRMYTDTAADSATAHTINRYPPRSSDDQAPALLSQLLKTDLIPILQSLHTTLDQYSDSSSSSSTSELKSLLLPDPDNKLASAMHIDRVVSAVTRLLRDYEKLLITTHTATTSTVDTGLNTDINHDTLPTTSSHTSHTLNSTTNTSPSTTTSTTARDSSSALLTELKVKDAMLEDQLSLLQDLRHKLGVYTAINKQLQHDIYELNDLIGDNNSEIAELEQQVLIKEEIEGNLNRLIRQLQEGNERGVSSLDHNSSNNKDDSDSLSDVFDEERGHNYDRPGTDSKPPYYSTHTTTAMAADTAAVTAMTGVIERLQQEVLQLQNTVKEKEGEYARQLEVNRSELSLLKSQIEAYIQQIVSMHCICVLSILCMSYVNCVCYLYTRYAYLYICTSVVMYVLVLIACVYFYHFQGALESQVQAAESQSSEQVSVRYISMLIITTTLYFDLLVYVYAYVSLYSVYNATYHTSLSIILIICVARVLDPLPRAPTPAQKGQKIGRKGI